MNISSARNLNQAINNNDIPRVINLPEGNVDINISVGASNAIATIRLPCNHQSQQLLI